MPVMKRTWGPEFSRECVSYYFQQSLRQTRHAPERAEIGTPDHFRLERPGNHAPAGGRRTVKGGGRARAARRRAAAALIVFTGAGILIFTVIPFSVVFLRTGRTGTALGAIAASSLLPAFARHVFPLIFRTYGFRITFIRLIGG